MAKIYTPNKAYTGVSAGVGFAKGIGWCTDERLLKWFEGKGYTVVRKDEEVDADMQGGEAGADGADGEAGADGADGEAGADGADGEVHDDEQTQGEVDLEKMGIDELRRYAADSNIFLGNSTSEAGIRKKILEAQAS